MSHGSTIRVCGLFTALGALAFGCDSPDVFLPFQQFGGPAGVIDGNLTYSGPLPCTQNQRVVGAAILLAFDVRLLPPPQGLGTSAASLEVVSGDALFSGVRDKLTFNADGSRWCPAPPAPGAMPETVTVSAGWAISPLPPATYQIRGFYDLDGNFDPGFSITNLPTKGDVGGGAIDNAAAVLVGAAPEYREIALVASDKGTRVAGVAVTLGLPLPLDRPIFHSMEVTDMYGKNMDPKNIVMPSDFQLEVFSAVDFQTTEASFLSVTLGAGVPAEEMAIATDKTKPFQFAGPGNFFFFSRQDVDRDGSIDSVDHIPEGPIPSMLPLAIFSKLADGSSLVAQSAPVVVIQGLTIWKSIAEMAQAMQLDKTFEPMGMEAISDRVKVGIRPAALCLPVTDPTRPGLLVVSHATDKAPEMHALLTNEKAVTDSLAEQFGRPIELAYGCLPEGRYAMNLIYETGQAWTVPNDAGVCAPSEPMSADGTMCGDRDRLDSQSVVLTVGPPDVPSYCESVPDAQKIREACSPIQ